MYCILVMTTAGAALDKCQNVGVNEGFEAWEQFVMEWEPILRTRYVGLLMNVLEYRFRDDIPTKLAAFERTAHDCDNQSGKTVDDDIKIGVTMLGMEDMRVKEHLIRNSVRITSWTQMREDSRDHANTTVHRQSTNANATRSESKEQRKSKDSKGKGKGKGKDVKGKGKAKDAKNESSKKAKNDDQTKCFDCNNPCVNSETSCESFSEQALRRPGAGSIAPAETQHVRPIAATPSNETSLMMDTCAGASIFPRGFDQSATDDSTVAPGQLSTATDDPVHGDAGKKSHFGL